MAADEERLKPDSKQKESRDGAGLCSDGPKRCQHRPEHYAQHFARIVAELLARLWVAGDHAPDVPADIARQVEDVAISRQRRPQERHGDNRADSQGSDGYGVREACAGEPSNGKGGKRQ